MKETHHLRGQLNQLTAAAAAEQPAVMRDRAEMAIVSALVPALTTANY